jgi:hypothetical protein
MWAISEIRIDLLVAVVGAVVSLLFSYVPGLSGWFYKQTVDARKGIMAIVVIVVAALMYGALALGIIEGLPLGAATAWKFAEVVFFVLAGNQIIYMISPDGSAERKLKAG